MRRAIRLTTALVLLLTFACAAAVPSAFAQTRPSTAPTFRIGQLDLEGRADRLMRQSRSDYEAGRLADAVAKAKAALAAAESLPLVGETVDDRLVLLEWLVVLSAEGGNDAEAA